MNKSRLLYSIGSAILILLIGITFFGITNAFKAKPNSNAANTTNTIKVVKNSTVTVYMNGYGVTKISENQNEVVYEVAAMNRIALRAVNESKIFERWSFIKPDGTEVTDSKLSGITNDSNLADSPVKEFDITIPYIAFRPNADFTIDTVRRDPLTTDYGRYMQNAYLIDTGSDLKQFGEMYTAGDAKLRNEAGVITNEDTGSITDTIVGYYDTFFKEDAAYAGIKDDPKYATITDEIEKKKQAIKDTFFNKLQWGYFNVTTSFGMFENDFFGFGSENYPFRGVFGGFNGTDISNIFVNTICTEREGDNYAGLFGVLKEEAVVRNLNITSSISFVHAGKEVTDTGKEITSSIYAGGLAGLVKAGFLYNLTISSKFAIDENIAKNIIVGGIAGKMTGDVKFIRFGINEYNNVKVNLSGCEWRLNSHIPGKSILAGGIVGFAQNTYIRGIDIDVSNYFVKVESSPDPATTNEITKVCIGNICGYYLSDVESPGMPVNAEIKDIRIHGTEAQSLIAVVTAGNAHVGGIIGYAEITKHEYALGIGQIDFAIEKGESQILAQSLDAASKANLYTGGLIGKMSDATIGNVVALSGFRNNVKRLNIDGEEKLVYDAIFEADYEIKSLQYGKEDGETFGKAVAGGLVGYGYIDMNGTVDVPATIIITKNDHTFKVSAIQTITTSTTQIGDDKARKMVKSSKEHATAGLVYGLFSVNPANIKISYADYFASNFALAATREMGSTSGGDVHAGGFVGYSYGADIDNVRCYFNDGSIRANSYSYDGKWTNVNYVEEVNNVYLGGIVGEFSGTSTPAQMTNCVLKGLDYETVKPIGTNIVIASVQNTRPPGENYSAENYTGGIIGRLFRGSVDNLQYLGSTGTEDYINMQSEQNPDTSFCGGIIGYIRNNDNGSALTTSVKNCLVQDATIRATTTTIQKIGTDIISDMYNGGIIGACFNGGAGNSKLTIEGCHIHDSTISAIGNEIQKVYAAGIIGICTWQGSMSIKNCHIADSNINAYAYYSAKASDDTSTYAAGILGESLGTVTIQNCGVFNGNILSYNENPGGTKKDNETIAAGFVGNINTIPKITRGYSRAKLQAEGVNTSYVQQYGIAQDNNVDTNKDRKNYYIKELAGTVSNTEQQDKDNLFIRLSTAAITITGEDQDFGSMDPIDRFHNKFYPKLLDGNFEITNLDVNLNDTTLSDDQKKVKLSIIPGKENVTDVLYIWVNVNENGENVNPHDPEVYKDDHTRNEHGWFLFAEVLVKSGEITKGDESMSVTDITYLRDEHEYDYIDATTGYVDRNYPHEAVTSIGYQETHTVESVDLDGNADNGKERNAILTMGVKIHGRIPVLKLQIKISNPQKDMNYYPIFFDQEIKADGTAGDITQITNFASMGYGSYQIVKIKESSTEITNDVVTYEFHFTPNQNLAEDHTFYLGFRYGSQGEYSTNIIKFHLIANKRLLEGAIYADYTEPINSYETEGLGTKTNPYLVRPNYTLKLIPVFTRSNDQEVDGKKPTYSTVANIQWVNYNLDENGQKFATIKADGELKCGASITGQGSDKKDILCGVTLTLIEDPKQTKTVYFRIIDVFDVSYSTTGATSSGLVWTSTDNAYSLDMAIDYGYNGMPKSFNVKVTKGNSTEYDEYNMDKIASNGWLRNEANQPITAWNENLEHYKLVIPNEASLGHITINAEFTAVYIITFDSQAYLFNDKYTPETSIMQYKVPYGETFKNYFSENFVTKTLKPWMDDKGIFGYVYRGSYLVDNANSIISYGLSFSQIRNSDLKITTSYTFYARWSFLIEIIEAPGTHVKTSFGPDFLDKYGVNAAGQELSKEELQALEINRAVTIPINANQGYAFTVEKDEDFIGKTNVQAFICTKVAGVKTLSEISIEKYYEDMYLYRIPAEVIRGYLVICTSVSNSELIVGENTSQVMDNVMPEDGVYTYKYVANHFKKPESISYIYNSGIEGNPNYNLGLNRNLLLRFYEEFYDLTTHQVKLTEKSLPIGTVVEVYYHQYIDGKLMPQETIVGTLTITTESVKQILLSDFLKLNLDEKAFERITFGDLLSGTVTLSEEYYFVITLPNGYTEYANEKYGSIVNNYVYTGYYDESKANEADPFVRGKRADYDLVNIPLENELEGFATSETSCHIREISIIPARQTTLTQNGTSSTEFTYKDNKYYDIFDLKINKGTMLADGTIVLTDADETTNTIIESDIVTDGILKLALSLGFNKGNVELYAKVNKDDAWELVTTINVDDYNFKTYTIDFNLTKQYKYFKLDNVSLKEIRLNSISVSTISNAMTYEFTGTDFKEAKKTKVDGNLTIIKMGKMITGDIRHEGKHFIMAVQFKDADGKIIENITNVTISINGSTTTHDPLNLVTGTAVSYFDLTDLAEELKVDEMVVTINCPEGYTVSTVLLLEATIGQKPAMSEVRYIISFNNN